MNISVSHSPFAEQCCSALCGLEWRLLEGWLWSLLRVCLCVHVCCREPDGCCCSSEGLTLRHSNSLQKSPICATFWNFNIQNHLTSYSCYVKSLLFWQRCHRFYQLFWGTECYSDCVWGRHALWMPPWLALTDCRGSDSIVHHVFLTTRWQKRTITRLLPFLITG